MRTAVELPDVYHVVFVLKHGGLVVVPIKVVGRAENGYDTRETSRLCLSVHAVSGILGFVCSNYRKQVILLEECARRRVGKGIRAPANTIVNEEIIGLFLTELLQRIGPQNIAHETVGWGFAEPVNLPTVSRH